MFALSILNIDGYPILFRLTIEQKNHQNPVNAMSELNYYATLKVSQNATSEEIKQAYRRLAKQFHPDSHRETASHAQIIEINAAYEILSDPQRRRSYDYQLLSGDSAQTYFRRQQRNTAAQNHYRHQQRQEREADIWQARWLAEVYTPINRLIDSILRPLEGQIEELSADPFDDQLMAAFEAYLASCRQDLAQARQAFSAQPNPAQCAQVAAQIYYCLNQISDGIDEFALFTLNYDDYYLNTGRELFRIAWRLYDEAQEAVDLR